jgi:uncharacterized protein YdaU (DUF1376 family)
MKWYSRDPHRAIEGMIGLSLEDIGAYNLLLDHAYAREGDLPDDPQLIGCMLRVHGNRWLAIRARLLSAGKMKIEGGKIVLNGVENTLKTARNFSETQRKRVGKRWEKSEKNNDNKEANIPKPDYTNTTTTTEKKEIAKAISKEKRAHPLPDDFEPDASCWNLADALLLTTEECRNELDRMRDWSKSAPASKGNKRDWNATLRNWLRKYASEKGKPNGKTPRYNRQDNFAILDAVISEAERREAADSSTGGEAVVVEFPGLREGTAPVLDRAPGMSGLSGRKGNSDPVASAHWACDGLQVPSHPGGHSRISAK